MLETGAFYYNRAVDKVNVNVVHNTYNTVVNNTTVNRVSFNGGPGGTRAAPTASERAAMNERHVEPTNLQLQHEHAAAGNRALFASENRGRPAIAATPQPGAFDHAGVVAARGNPAARNAQALHDGSGPQEHASVQHGPGEGAPHPHQHAEGGGAGHPRGGHAAGEPRGEGPRH